MIQIYRWFSTLLWALLACFSIQVVAQTLTVSSSQLAFATTYENSPDSLPLYISNTLGHDVQVTGLRFYNTYSQPAFSADRSTFTVYDQSSETVWIKFSPRQNIFHNSELVIENNSHRGNISVDLTGQGRFSLAYYDSSTNLSDEDLKNSLKYITGNGYDSLGYAIARDSMFMIIDNKRVNGQGVAQNTIECIYTGRQAIGYTSRTDCQTNYSFNTEHTYPQSLFSSLEPMKSDLHHLFPTDDNANNVRGSYPFGVVSNPTWQQGGSKYANSIFEPRDAQKGATARAMLYFVIRYQNYSGFLTSQESILRSWHTLFSPSQEEIIRNEKISRMQHNRNPFVDYPQFLERITSVSTTSVQSPVYSIDFSEPLIDYGYVASSVNHIYHYLVVNTGNRNIQFTSFSLSPGSIFSFVNGSGVNATLSPGEALQLDINLLTAPSSAINGSLNFNTNISGQSSVTIPIHADGASPVGEMELPPPAIRMYPNPVSDVLTIEKGNGKKTVVHLTDPAGRAFPFQIISDEKEKMMINISFLSPGIYFLHLVENQKNSIIKIAHR